MATSEPKQTFLRHGEDRSRAYDGDFYSRRDASTSPSAEIIVPLVLELVSARSVIDLGCGVGTWLKTFEANGVCDIFGVEGPWLNDQALVISKDRFRHHDLEAPLALDRKFDLALCLEVAEHLPESAAGVLVQNLTALAPVVLFSAAIPFQGGQGHLNERWPVYWTDLFGAHQYFVIDTIRTQLWEDRRVKPWYAQNLLVFASRRAISTSSRLSAALEATDSNRLNLAHPFYYERNSDLTRASLRSLVAAVPRLLLQRVTSRLRGGP